MVSNPKLTIGADPEFFLMNAEGSVVSAHDIVPGTKKKPYKLDGGAVQVDGTAVEFNLDPCTNAKEFNEKIDLVLEQIRQMVPSKYTFLFTPYWTYDQKYFNTLPDYAKEMGCDPDFHAYNDGAPIDPPRLPNRGAMARSRSCGGHIHVGWGSGFDITDHSHIADCCLYVQTIDRVYQMIEKTIHFRNRALGLRRQLYGNPGAMRFKSYGLEYRSPSSLWVADRTQSEYIFELAKAVFLRLQDGQPIRQTPIGPRDMNRTGVNLSLHETFPDLPRIKEKPDERKVCHTS